jgi:y4mF family transcriptional regulator
MGIENLPIGKFRFVFGLNRAIFPDREIFGALAFKSSQISRSGNIMTTTTVSDPPALGRLVRETRRALGLTQPSLALSAGVGVRFLVDIEKGKPTAQIGKIMRVLAALGIELQLLPPNTVKAINGRS